MSYHRSQREVSRRSVLKHGAIASAVGLAGISAASGVAGANKRDSLVPTDYSTIQDAVDDATDGDTVCIQPGSYAEDVTVDTEVTVRGRTAPNSNAPARLDGQIEITTGADGTAVRRLRISPMETFPGGTFPDPAGVRVKASDVVVEHNVIEDFDADLSNGNGSFTMHGVQVFGADGGNVSNVSVRGNVIRGFSSDGFLGDWPKYGGIAAVKAQADVEDVTVSNNVIRDHHSAGWVWGVVLTPSGSAPGVPSDVTVERNHVTGLNDGSVYDVFGGPNDGRNVAPYPGSAVGIDGTADATGTTVRRNNLLAPNGAESKDQNGPLVAECNWWGDRSGPTHADNSGGVGTWALERGTAEIDYKPWLTAPAPSKACNGGQQPGHGSGNKL